MRALDFKFPGRDPTVGLIVQIFDPVRLTTFLSDNPRFVMKMSMIVSIGGFQIVF